MIGAGVGAAGTSLLALLATRVAPERRAAAASITWIMMIAGIVVTAGVAGRADRSLLAARGWRWSPAASPAAAFAGRAAGGVGRRGRAAAAAPAATRRPRRRSARRCARCWADDEARRFTVFVFLSMLAYSMQDLILEPFAGLLFGFTPGAVDAAVGRAAWRRAGRA